jgi:DNA-binding PadR family transcriptional regulator
VDRVDDLLPLQPAVFHILMALAEDDRHGYALIQAIAERSDRRIRMSAGTLYRSIHRMLEDGLVVEIDKRPGPEDDGRRRYYRITPLGRKAARAEAQRLADLVNLARASGLAPRKA